MIESVIAQLMTSPPTAVYNGGRALTGIGVPVMATPKAKKSDEVELDPEAWPRFEATLKRALSTPHSPHRPLKAKPRTKAAKGKAGQKRGKGAG